MDAKVKHINELLENIVDEYAEIILAFKESTTKREELEKVVSTKRKTISLCNKITEIYNTMVEMRYK